MNPPLSQFLSGSWRLLPALLVPVVAALAEPSEAADPHRVLLRCGLDEVVPVAGSATATTECVRTRLSRTESVFEPVQATVHGDARIVDGRFGPSSSDRALEFDGDGDYLTIEDMPTLDGATAITVEAWVWVESPSTNVFRIQQPLTLGSHHIQVHDSDGGLGWTPLSTYGQVVPTEAWYHIAGVFNQRELRIYLNGRLSDERILDHEALTSSGEGYDIWSIGARALSTGADQEFQGQIDEVAVYAAALPAGTLLRHAKDRKTYPVEIINVRTHSTITPPVLAQGDGLTDDAAAIQDSIDYAATVGGEVFLPPGTYRIGTELQVPSGILIRGDQGTILQPLDGEKVNPILNLDNIENTTIRDLELRGRSFKNAQSAGHAGIWISGSERIHIDNIGFSDLGNAPDSYGGIHLILEALEGLSGSDGASLHNVIENNHFDDWDHLASFGIRFVTRWEKHHLTPREMTPVRENIVKNNFLAGFFQAVEIAGPDTTGNLIRGNTALGPLIVGVEADKGARQNIYLENTIYQVRAPGDSSISGMRDQGFLQCNEVTNAFEYELMAEGNVFLRNVIYDVANGRNAGGILLSRTQSGLFQGNMVRTISGGNKSAMVLKRDGLVSDYIVKSNLRDPELLKQETIMATACPG